MPFDSMPLFAVLIAVCADIHMVTSSDVKDSDVTEICPSRRVGHFKAPCSCSGWMKTRINNQTEFADNGNLLITL